MPVAALELFLEECSRKSSCGPAGPTVFIPLHIGSVSHVHVYVLELELCFVLIFCQHCIAMSHHLEPCTPLITLYVLELELCFMLIVCQHCIAPSHHLESCTEVSAYCGQC